MTLLTQAMAAERQRELMRVARELRRGRPRRARRVRPPSTTAAARRSPAAESLCDPRPVGS